MQGGDWLTSKTSLTSQYNFIMILSSLTSQYNFIMISGSEKLFMLKICSCRAVIDWAVRRVVLASWRERWLLLSVLSHIIFVTFIIIIFVTFVIIIFVILAYSSCLLSYTGCWPWTWLCLLWYNFWWRHQGWWRRRWWWLLRW